MFAGFARAGDGWAWCNGREGRIDFDLGNFLGVFAGRRGGAGGGRRGGRMFEQGDLKLVVLRLLEEKPRHGYDIIKALEERSNGLYTPSPGAVYPTLQLLEEMGYARAVDDGNGRRIYEITDEGRKHLAEHRAAADDVFERVSNVAEAGVEAFGELAGAFGSLGRAAFRRASRARGDRELLRRVREIIEAAEREIEQLG